MRASQQSLPSPALKTPSTVKAGGKTGRSHRPLPMRFRIDGFDLKQIARVADIAVYQQTRTECPNFRAYEIVHIRKRDGFWIEKRFVEPAEYYPRSDEWGAHGFTQTNKEAAFVKMRELISNLV